jgi:hypothetical protein
MQHPNKVRGNPLLEKSFFLSDPVFQQLVFEDEIKIR